MTEKEKIYCICSYDYINKKSNIIEALTDKYNALHEIEKMAYNYVYDKNGENMEIKMFIKDEKGRPEGYYMYRNAKKYLDKIKIKQKVVNKGYLYNVGEFKTIISFFLIESERDRVKTDGSFYVAPGNSIYRFSCEEGDKDPKKKVGNNFKILMDELRNYKLCKLSLECENAVEKR